MYPSWLVMLVILDVVGLSNIQNLEPLYWNLSIIRRNFCLLLGLRYSINILKTNILTFPFVEQYKNVKRINILP